MAPALEIQLGNEMNDWSDKNEMGCSDVASNSSLQSQVNPSTNPFSCNKYFFLLSQNRKFFKAKILKKGLEICICIGERVTNFFDKHEKTFRVAPALNFPRHFTVSANDNGCFLSEIGLDRQSIINGQGLGSRKAKHSRRRCEISNGEKTHLGNRRPSAKWIIVLSKKNNTLACDKTSRPLKDTLSKHPRKFSRFPKKISLKLPIPPTKRPKWMLSS